MRLCVIEKMADHNLLRLMEAGCRVTINLDDPTYFGGFVNDNYVAVNDAFNLTRRQALQLAHNSFAASFATNAVEQQKIEELYHFARTFKDQFGLHFRCDNLWSSGCGESQIAAYY